MDKFSMCRISNNNKEARIIKKFSIRQLQLLINQGICKYKKDLTSSLVLLNKLLLQEKILCTRMHMNIIMEQELYVTNAIRASKHSLIQTNQSNTIISLQDRFISAAFQQNSKVK